MELSHVMDGALREGPEAVAIACADVRAGFVLGTSAREAEAAEAAENGALCAAQVCSLPEGPDPNDVVDGSSALVVSSRWIHAYARVAHRPELVIVGVGHPNANVALLLAWVKRVAGSIEANS